MTINDATRTDDPRPIEARDQFAAEMTCVSVFLLCFASDTDWPSEISDDPVGYFATAIDFPSRGDTSSEKGRSKNEREL
jgi:hypothetical protein